MKEDSKIKSFYQKYKHAVPMLVFGVIYIEWFTALERNVVNQYTVIQMRIDNYIPFCEWFVIPYLLWFVYIAAAVVCFFFTEKKSYVQLCIFLAVGMTIFLIVSTVFPNGQHLRPEVFPRDNILTRLVGMLYRADTPTNILPSIHVYNSIGVHIAISRSKRLMDNRLIQTGSFILSLSIILATVFIKQHSMVDVICACLMSAVVYASVYLFDYTALTKYLQKKESVL